MVVDFDSVDEFEGEGELLSAVVILLGAFCVMLLAVDGLLLLLLIDV